MESIYSEEFNYFKLVQISAKEAQSVDKQFLIKQPISAPKDSPLFFTADDVMAEIQKINQDSCFDELDLSVPQALLMITQESKELQSFLITELGPAVKLKLEAMGKSLSFIHLRMKVLASDPDVKKFKELPAIQLAEAYLASDLCRELKDERNTFAHPDQKGSPQLPSMIERLQKMAENLRPDQRVILKKRLEILSKIKTASDKFQACRLQAVEDKKKLIKNH